MMKMPDSKQGTYTVTELPSPRIKEPQNRVISVEGEMDILELMTLLKETYGSVPIRQLKIIPPKDKPFTIKME